MNSKEKLAKYWCDKHRCDPFDFSDYYALGELLEQVQDEQRKLCANAVHKRLAGNGNYPCGTFQAVEDACLNARGKR